MSSVRDNQRSKVYKAEDVLLDFAKPLPKIEDVVAFCQKTQKRKTIVKRYPRAERPIAVKDGRGTRRALAYGGYAISIPQWARNEAIVVHEIAHIMTNRHFGDVAGHGWEYCSVFLDLVRYTMGKEAYMALKQSFKEHKVKFRAPRKKT